MSEIGSISVSINGDASGLLSAASSAQAAVTSLNTAINGLKSSDVSVAINAVDNATAVVDSASGTVNAFGELRPEAVISALDKTAAGVASAKAAINSIQDKVVTVTVRVNKQESGSYAKGTMSAPEGLARINDEKGVADPRELVYHRGNYYLFEGRDVLVPLDRGDKVYTASQTKNIMNMNGIPSYASGKNNEMFDFDKRMFNYRAKTSNMPLTEQIEWWQSALKVYAYDMEALMECSEEIFELTQDMVKELNEESKDYVIERSQLNDWSKFGDTELDAFSRIRDRNFEYLKQGVITWKDYCETIDDIGSEMYEERIKHSENWLEQEYKYNNMAIDDYIAGLDRMAAYTQEFYNNGLIGDVDYFYGMQDISNKKADMRQKANNEEYKSWRKSADGYLKQREVYGDWKEYGDNLIDYYNRCIERHNEFFAAGKIDWETYNDEIINYKMEIYKAEKAQAEETYKTLLNYAKEYTANVKTALKTEKDDLNYELKSEELDEELVDAARIRSIYKGAVTQKGKDVYDEAQDKINEIGRDRAKLELERSQAQTLRELEKEYKAFESSKGLTIDKIMNGTLDVSSILSTVESEFALGQSNICSLLNDLISAVKSNGAGTVYGGTTYNITGADASIMGPFLQRGTMAFAGR